MLAQANFCRDCKNQNGSSIFLGLTLLDVGEASTRRVRMTYSSRLQARWDSDGDFKKKRSRHDAFSGQNEVLDNKYKIILTAKEHVKPQYPLNTE